LNGTAEDKKRRDPYCRDAANCRRKPDMSKERINSGTSRRSFFNHTGLVLGGGVVGAGLGYQTPAGGQAEDHESASEVENASAADWPWPVHYGQENEIETDVLVIGGGLAGSHAAINAAGNGAKVLVMDKGPIAVSGSGGTGIDHWLGCLLNPCSKLTAETLEVEADTGQGGEYGLGNARYIMMREGWDALKDLEDWGLQIRDDNDEFKGSCWRDEETKLLFAYDADNKYSIRLPGGSKMKTVLYRELKRRDVSMLDFTMATALLTEGGKVGGRVIGVTGLNIRTGEFFIIKAKAVVLASSRPQKLWVFGTEPNGSVSSFHDPNNTGDGYDIAWRAGAEFVNMEFSHKGIATGAFAYPPYAAGNAHNTWYPCTIVDADGKEVPWVDHNGKALKTVEERYKASRRMPGELHPASLVKDLPDRIRRGEFKLPLYADLPSMPEQERRAIWGLQVANAGKTRIPVYDLYQRYGFDPGKDMLQVPVMSPDAYTLEPWWMGEGAPHYRESCFWSGSLLMDWSMGASLPGLYAAGGIGGQAAASGSSATGRYAGRQAAAFAKKGKALPVSRNQIDAEKARVYAPVTRPDGIGWKELKAGLCRVMQDYCGEYRSEETLKLGLQWFESIRESEASSVCARNPRELARVLECLTHINVGEMMMHASLARKASSRPLGLRRLDYPEQDPAEWQKFIAMRQETGGVKFRDLPLKYWCAAPYASSYAENYRRHCNPEA
jgi:succinate dehydrogenase/fumarate reductase flavoprotein subunit